MKPLWEIRVTAPRAAEAALADLMMRAWGQPPVIYADDRSAMTRLSLFVEHGEHEDRTARRTWELGLHLLKASGLALEPCRWAATRVRREDWAESWKKHFPPLEIGDALLIKPTWSRRRPHAGQAVVVLDPGLSFGTGHHPTTAFCLHQLVACRAARKQASLLDVGTGSGILAIAGAQLGYRPVQALDFDAEAVRAARQNARLNGVLDQLEIRRADFTTLPLPPRGRFDLVCANLEFPLLASQVQRLLRYLRPGGTLVLAGILEREFTCVQNMYTRAGLTKFAEEKNAEWHSGAFRRADA